MHRPTALLEISESAWTPSSCILARTTLACRIRMAGSAVASKLKRPRSVTPSTLLGWLQLAGSAVFLSYHSVAAWLTVLLGRLRGKHPLSHPEWPLDLALISAGFRVCMEKGCMVDFRPLLSGLSLLQFYPGLRLQRVNAGGCKAYWMRLRGGREVQHAQVVLFYVHGGAFVGGDACMTAWTFQHWMQRLTGSGLHAAVLSVEYPLAPERRFPAAVVDTAAAYTWLRQQLQQQGSSACIIPVADSAGANILVAALTALRDISSGSSMDELLQGAVAQTAAAERSNDQHSSAEAAAEVQDAVAELFTSLKDRLCQINGSSSSSSSSNALSRASSSSSSNTGSSSLNVSSSLATALSSSGSTTVPDMTAQIGASAEITRAAGSSGAAAAAAAAAAFVPPAAMVLVSPAMDISKQACFYDEEWRAQHEPRFDYLPVSVVGGGMHHYVGSTALLACGYVSPLHAASLAGLAGGPWLVLAGGAELMARDIDSFVERLRCSVGAAAVQHHVEPHLPHSWAILPTPSMWPRQEVVLRFITEQVAAHAKGL